MNEEQGQVMRMTEQQYKQWKVDIIRAVVASSLKNDCECKDCKLQGTGRPIHIFKETK